MPWPAPVMMATRSCRRPLIGPPSSMVAMSNALCPFVRSPPARSRPVDEVEPLGENGLAGLVVLPDRLRYDEGHYLALALLLIGVDDLALADEHVADDDRAVVDELLLPVEDEAATRHERADDLHHRVALHVALRLDLAERAPVAHREPEGRRRRDVVETGRLGGPRVAGDRVLVLHRRGEVRDRAALDDDA